MNTTELEKKVKELERRIEQLERNQPPIKIVGHDYHGRPLVVRDLSHEG